MSVCVCVWCGYLSPHSQPLPLDQYIIAATLAQRLAIVQEQNRESTSRIQRLQNELIERNELEIKIEALQSAHAAQCAHLATLKQQLRGASVDKREVRFKFLVVSIDCSSRIAVTGMCLASNLLVD